MVVIIWGYNFYMINIIPKYNCKLDTRELKIKIAAFHLLITLFTDSVRRLG